MSSSQGPGRAFRPSVSAALAALTALAPGLSLAAGADRAPTAVTQGATPGVPHAAPVSRVHAATVLPTIAPGRAPVVSPAAGAPGAWPAPVASAAPAALNAAVSASAPGWAQAVDDAWLRSPGGRALAARRAQWQASRDVAGSWLAEAPAVTLSNRSDRWQANRGRREWEAELELPLRLPEVRGATQAAVQAQGDAAQARWVADRLALAGEVREAAWALRLADVEAQAARLRVEDAQALARDVARRVAAGELARLDAHRADAAVPQAQAALARAEAALLRARAAYQALTGHAEPPLDTEPPLADAGMADMPPPAPAATASGPGGPGDHPLLHAARLAVRRARAELALADAENRDAPALIVGLSRERDAFSEPSATTTRIGVRWPLALESRNRASSTAARAELAQAEAEADALLARLSAEARAAQAEHAQARRVQQLARTQAQQTAQAQALVARAFAMGEADLPTRLRADAEHQQALLESRRAELEAGRALSRLRQALGLLPAGPLRLDPPSDGDPK